MILTHDPNPGWVKGIFGKTATYRMCYQYLLTSSYVKFCSTGMFTAPARDTGITRVANWHSSTARSQIVHRPIIIVNFPSKSTLSPL